MKYGIYTSEETNVITSWIFKLEDNAEEHGFVKIGETRTMSEANKLFKEISIFKLNK